LLERRNSANFLNARYWFCCRVFRVIVLVGFGFILFKAFQLQVLEYSLWLERERAQTETSLQVPTYRGSIYDCQGRLMSYSVPQRSLYADSDQVENSKQLAARLAPILGEPEPALQKKLSCGRHFVWIKRHLSDQQALAVEDLKARGLNLATEFKRFYPYRQVGGQVVGFVGMDGTGLEGIEKAFDDVLRQKSNTVDQFRDGVRKCVWLGSTPPPQSRESYGVRLTLDGFLQYLAELELEKCISHYRARAGEVVITDPQTFEILAVATWPFFDPNLSDKKNADSWRNRAITDSFEPGSTFKVFLVSAALEENTIKERDRVFCENGKCSLAGHTINDTHSYGWLSIPEVIKYSSNIGASKLALQLGCERYYNRIQAFGFGSLSGVNLPGEVKGLVRPWKKWRPIDLATAGFGQGIGVTALQLTMGIASIAHEGEYGQPQIAKEIVDEQGQTVKRFQTTSLRRVLQKKTANQVREMMRGVTLEGGTGVNAAPEGYTVAGKTGTAQVLDTQTHRYAAHKYTSVFTGFIPVEHPRLVITVVIHEPQGAIYGGVVAAPVFKNIAAKALPYLGVLPSYEGGARPPVELRLVNATAREVSKPSVPVISDKSNDNNKDKDKDKNASVMPDLSGLSLKVALQRLAPLGVQTKVQGSGKVVGQLPQVGALLKPKAPVELVLNEVR